MLSLLRCFTALVAFALFTAHGMPIKGRHLSDPDYGPIPSESSYYSDYRGTDPPFPANVTDPIQPTANGPPAPDDRLFQNLLAAEWIIFSFYQQGVELFTAASFKPFGFPDTTYDRLQEIRDAEAGHLRIFQDLISPTSVKPGACQYDFAIKTNPQPVIYFLALQLLIEIGSMAFGTGLVQQAQELSTRGTLVALGEAETRHGVWSLIDIWNVDPFAGPIETSFPYANQILDATNQFVIPGSCPQDNPVYPNPRQGLPQLSFITKGSPGSNITFTYVNPNHKPDFQDCNQYFAVFFHGLQVLSSPFDPQTSTSVIPAAFEKKGVIIAVIADQEGAPTEDSVVAGPAFLLQQPANLVGVSLD